MRKLQNGNKDSLADIIECMDDYFLTREDWDAIIELGVGPNAEESVKIPSLLRSAFTRTYNQMSHPMPFMKASSVTATKAAKKEVPDIEDAFVESEDELVGAAEDELKAEADEADISKDKYIKAPKKKPAPRKAKAKAGGGDEEKAPKAAAARGKAAAGRGGAKAARGKK